jgi:hypothetical protein
MPMSSALRGPGAGARVQNKLATWSALAVIVCCTVALASCDSGRALRLSRAGGTAGAESATPLPLPRRALLRRQPAPKCDFTTAEPNADELRKLDYERQCYRHAEMIARGRLELLQDSVARTIKAVKRGEGSEL